MAQEICGKWKLVYADNVGEYCEAIGSAKQYTDMTLKFLLPANNIVQEIEMTDNTVTITTTMPGKTTNVKATFGSTSDIEFLDGRPIQSVFTVDGNKLKEEQSGSFQSTNLRFLEGDKMFLTMTSNGVTMTRKYERI